MKTQIIILLLLIPTTFFGQQITYKQWARASKSDIRLLPKYGYLPKTRSQLKADETFCKKTIALDGTAEKASAHLINLGFDYLYRDLKTAMYRFNQAFLLDSANSDIYWGYGAIYFMLNRPDLARVQYEQGLERDPDNWHILTDNATLFIGEYYKTKNDMFLNKAISMLSDSYALNQSYESTSYKLASCYLLKNDCKNAQKYYEICMSYGGDPIDEQFKAELKKRCK